MAIRIFVTGGTFDKSYNELTGELYFKDTHLLEMLKLGRCKTDLQIRTLMMTDSLSMTEEDRKIILNNCQKAAEERIVITHGTDTMVETARHLADIKGKTVVLTGALEPALFKTSDAVFNIGCAVASVQILNPGVYVAMNGCIFTPDRVRKNREANRFEST